MLRMGWKSSRTAGWSLGRRMLRGSSPPIGARTCRTRITSSPSPAGNSTRSRTALDGLPVAVFVPPSGTAEAPNTFLDTKKIISFYQKEIGVPFPWAKYYQVFCLDFVAGGMENTSCTFNAESLIFSTDSEQLDTLHRLDAHETAHQWFGDLVTCRDWAHLWLNEGFATYYTVLYEQEKNGDDAMRYSLWREALDVFRAAPRHQADGLSRLHRPDDPVRLPRLSQGRVGPAHAAQPTRPGAVPQRDQNLSRPPPRRDRHHR